ncbi:FKBP-type peptidyl-prolyl cis-trans isomerase [Faecalibacter rhinopitheci]|uniref:Peptidyl-prolyl cis-trans isomerase n=1 Tax=Faecalibacter rhinopitheci TaxID=2779678 RepID=A0A8J7K3C1_9FLAO|nr:peptidylprolyl isomerase [Faecalibacter rhinopitheci]MBF0596363.1 peptidylprolyl isomerase [Faecalibacter rhinopitheci]MBQ0148015.1 peptidylprolyl isomerase [Candidatus Onthonaster equi]
MTIENNHVVTVNYVLNTIEANGEKVFVEQSNAEEPLAFLFGAGMMIPKFEAELQGLQAGDKKSFVITPEEGYGERNDEAIAQLPLEMFKESGLPPVGAVLPLNDNQGNQFRATVVEVTEEVVIADLNPPMAGKTLNFDVEVINVRPATEEELAHGHAHGADGTATH